MLLGNKGLIKIKSEIFWNNQSTNYDKKVKRYQQTYSDTIERSKKYLKNDDIILDFACGTGITTIPISNFVKKIYAIDLSQRMIDIADKKAKLNKIDNIIFFKSDLFNKDLNKYTFDAVLAFNSIYFLENAYENLKRIYEITKPNGLFISATDCLGENKSLVNGIVHLLSKIGAIPYIKRYSVSGLKELILDSGFTIVEAANLFNNPPNIFIVAKKNA